MWATNVFSYMIFYNFKFKMDLIIEQKQCVLIGNRAMVAPDTFMLNSCWFLSPVTFSDLRLLLSSGMCLQTEHNPGQTKGGGIQKGSLLIRAEGGVVRSFWFFSVTIWLPPMRVQVVETDEDIWWAAADECFHGWRQNSY